jgi:hypothetical protein
MKKFNIIKDLKEKIVKELFLSSDTELTPSELDIINICADVINSILDEKVDLERSIYNLNIEIKNLKINFEDLLKDNKLLNDEIKKLNKK